MEYYKVVFLILLFQKEVLETFEEEEIHELSSSDDLKNCTICKIEEIFAVTFTLPNMHGCKGTLNLGDCKLPVHIIDLLPK